jgi:hypothetical protein
LCCPFILRFLDSLPSHPCIIRSVCHRKVASCPNALSSSLLPHTLPDFSVHSAMRAIYSACAQMDAKFLRNQKFAKSGKANPPTHSKQRVKGTVDHFGKALPKDDFKLFGDKK